MIRVQLMGKNHLISTWLRIILAKDSLQTLHLAYNPTASPQRTALQGTDPTGSEARPLLRTPAGLHSSCPVRAAPAPAPIREAEVGNWRDSDGRVQVWSSNQSFILSKLWHWKCWTNLTKLAGEHAGSLLSTGQSKPAFRPSCEMFVWKDVIKRKRGLGWHI